MADRYWILTSSGTEDLGRRVSEALDDGWTLHGTLLAVEEHGATTYYQAVTRPKKGKGRAVSAVRST